MSNPFESPEVARAQWIARIIGGVLLLIVLVIEIFLELETGSDVNSFSSILRSFSLVGIGAPFGWGTLMGHFFHPVDGFRSLLKINENLILIIAVAPILLLVGADAIVAAASEGWVYPSWVSPLMLLAGTIWGSLVWPVTIEGPRPWDRNEHGRSRWYA